MQLRRSPFHSFRGEPRRTVPPPRRKDHLDSFWKPPVLFEETGIIGQNKKRHNQSASFPHRSRFSLILAVSRFMGEPLTIKTFESLASALTVCCLPSVVSKVKLA
jgi:hypothetical protein